VFRRVRNSAPLNHMQRSVRRVLAVVQPPKVAMRRIAGSRR
jgi:hypothetical protein